MKKIFKVMALGLFALLPSLSFAQSPQIPIGLTISGGVFYTPNYNYGATSKIAPMKITQGTTSTGVGTVTVSFGYFNTPDGRQVTPFTGVTTLPPITIDTGANIETVTPSAVSCSTPIVINTCQITATFSFIHGNGVNISSGDQGLQEAINDAGSLGGGMVYWVLDGGTVTLATGAANTNIGTIAIPTRSYVMGATARVNTTITGCTGGWSLGYTTGVEFTSANATLTAGTTTDSSTLVAPVLFNGTATIPVIHCTTANATAGAVHARVWGYKMAAPLN